jgi:hypothetical protein
MAEKNSVRDEAMRVYEEACNQAGEPLSQRQRDKLGRTMAVYNLVRTNRSPKVTIKKEHDNSGRTNMPPAEAVQPVEQRLRHYLSMPQKERDELDYFAGAIGIPPIYAFQAEMTHAGKEKEFVAILEEFLGQQN